MALFVFLTDQVREDVAKMGVPLQKLEQLATEIEAAQSTEAFDRFPKPCLTKKKWLARANRLIAADKNIDEHLVVFLLRLCVRGSHEYDKLLKDPAGYAEAGLQRVLRASNIGDWLARRIEEPVPSPPPDPSASELQFLWGHGIPKEVDDGFIFETRDWIESITHPRVASRLVLIPNTISKILDGNAEPQICSVDGYPELKVVYRYSSERKWIVLLSALYEPSDDEINAVSTRWDSLAKQDGAQAVMRSSVRSYPALICYDPDLWVMVEKDASANLALSPEEASILDSTGHAASGYPLFINGRAGSGKSTILQYLFAHQYAAWLANLAEDAGEFSRPLYFASSAELLKIASGVVRSLLTANSNMLLRNSVANAGDALQRLQSSFCHFHEFLYSLLDAQHSMTTFRRDWRVTYPVFRRLWLQRFGKDPRAIRAFGPQLSWHVIRSYIKGLSIEGATDHDDYAELPRDERSISDERYQEVYEKVWNGWFLELCKEEGFWDDQDLVRHLLDQGIIVPRHCAVACDEAQDFTRIEIEAIYRMSVFSNRLLEPESVRRVPLAFAGDPFQTLNPTGFRWEAIKAGFTERLLCALHRFRERCSIPQLNYHELRFNYRSTNNIVLFCNTIQAVRAAALSISSLRPQTAWRLESGSPMAAFFAETDPVLLSRLQQQSDLVIVVPCEEGEEQEFVRKSDFLSSWVKLDDEGTPENVLSPMRAKGLEFNRVLLYGFAEHPDAGLLEQQLTARATSKEPDRDATLSLEYFMNGLYVAASRARKRLFVVDNEKALVGLWRFAADDEHLVKLLRLLPNRGEAWQGNVSPLIKGLDDHWSDEDRDNPNEIAEKYEDKGKRDQDPYFLRQAAIQYGNLKNRIKTEECRAFADRFERKYLDCGRRFQQIGMCSDALRAFWDGALFSQVRILSEAYPEVGNTLESRVAAFITDANPSLEAALLVFQRLGSSIRDAHRSRLELLGPSWQKALNEVLRRVSALTMTQAATTHWVNLAATLSELERQGLSFDRMLLGKILYRAGRFDEVLAALADESASELYRDAKAQLILNQVRSDSSRVPPDEAKLVGDLLEREGRKTEAAYWHRSAGDLVRTEDCLVSAVMNSRTSAREIIELMTLCVLTAADKGRFDYILALCDHGGNAPSRSRKGRGEGSEAIILGNKLTKLGATERQRILEAIRTESAILTRVIPAFARSEQLNWSNGREVADFLRRHLLVDDPAWHEWRALLSAIVAGAAIERAGKDIDALLFYERLQADKKASPAEIIHSKKRWIRCKLRQAQREKTLADIEKRPGKQATQHQEDAERELRANGWSINDLEPEFPNVPEATTPDAPASTMNTNLVPTVATAIGRPVLDAMQSFAIAGLTFRPFRERNRINVESASGDIARIDIGNRDVTSDDILVSREIDGSFRCASWNLVVMFQDGTQGVLLRVADTERTIWLDEQIRE